MRAMSLRLHRFMPPVAAAALFIFGLSGLLHPILVTFGPKQAVFLPPSAPLGLDAARPLGEILPAAGIDRAAAVRIVASQTGSLLQVTEEQFAERRYFRLDTGEELPGYDAVQAAFLARHYTGATEPVARIERLEAFTPAYPPVNRLLPVYEVRFDRPDGLRMYVYTETNAAAGVSNHVKDRLQTAFRWLHSWSWFPRQAEWARVLLIALLVGAALAMTVSGVAMLLLIRRKRRAPGIRGWHRLAGYAVAMPLLGFTTSGLHHLFTHAGPPEAPALSMARPLDLRALRTDVVIDWDRLSAGRDIAAVSLVADGQGRLLLRLGPRASGQEPVYVDPRTGLALPLGDRELAMSLAARFTGQPEKAIKSATLVTRFGTEYDFRNKRLPVWKIDYGPPVDALLFIDTATGVLADRIDHADRPERFSFSYLHKANWLRPLGRARQNGIVGVTALFIVVFGAGLGLTLDLKRRRRAARERAYRGPSVS